MSQAATVRAAAAVTGAAAPSSAAAIAATGIRKRYGDRTVLDGVDLRVDLGEIVALLGPNGAGKTTLVEIIEGYRSADGGAVEILGRRAAREDRAVKSSIGLMLQSGGLDPRATPADVLALYASFFDGARSPVELLDLVGLRPVARTRVRRLSGGERQRLGLALALVGDPPILLLDEPTAGMDPEARRATRDLIASLRGEGRAILLTTHDLGDVEHLADRVAILHHGRIRAEGSPAQLMQGAATELRFRLHAPATDPALARLGAALRGAEPIAESTATGGNGTYRIAGAGATADAIAEIAAWAVREGHLIVELRAGAASLEDRYLELTGDRDVEAAA